MCSLFPEKANRDELCLYNIYLDSFDMSGDDVKRLRNKSRFSLIHKFARPEDEGTITTFACARVRNPAFRVRTREYLIY